MWKHYIQAHKHSQDKIVKISEQLLIEKELQIYINNELRYTTLSTPEKRPDLAKGYLLAQYGRQNVPDSSLEKEGNSIYITTDVIDSPLQKTPNPTLSCSQIKTLMAAFQDNVQLYKDTGIAHSAAITSTDKIHHFGDDINRYNALYKCLSFANTHNDWGDGILIMSGKCCSNVVQACINVGLNTIISRTGITESAYQLAVEHHCTVIGFCRGKHFTIFTGRDHITEG